MTEMAFKMTGNEIAANDSSCLPIDHYHVEHFMTRVHLYIAQCHLPFKRLVSADQELLARLPGRIKSTLHLRSTERPVAKQSTVFACERHTLCNTLVDDVCTYFC